MVSLCTLGVLYCNTVYTRSVILYHCTLGECYMVSICTLGVLYGITVYTKIVILYHCVH